MREKGIGFYLTTGLTLVFFTGVAGFAIGAVKPQKTESRVEQKVSGPLAVGAYDYNYSPQGKSDPFQPFMETDINVIKKKEEELKRKSAKLLDKTISPLQKVDLTQFELVGIAIDENARTAIVEDKTAKKHYPVFVGTYIGLNKGRVAEILPDRFIVEEMITRDDTPTKKKQMKRIEVFLHKEQ